MNFKITNNPKYIKDIKRFTTAIETVNDGKRKAYFTKVFAEFISLAQRIDNNHDSTLNQKIEPTQIRDDVKQLQDLRYQLDQLSKDAINS